jgi:hypothetical protein
MTARNEREAHAWLDTMPPQLEPSPYRREPYKRRHAWAALGLMVGSWIVIGAAGAVVLWMVQR